MKKFSNSLPGYNKSEVNSFVQTVTDEYENLLNTLKKRDQELIAIQKELVRYKNLESTLNRAILIAEESVQNIKKSAFDEAKVVVENARRNASRIVNNALIKAEKAENEAEALKKYVERYKNRYRNLLESELDAVERLDLDE